MIKVKELKVGEHSFKIRDLTYGDFLDISSLPQDTPPTRVVLETLKKVILEVDGVDYTSDKAALEEKLKSLPLAVVNRVVIEQQKMSEAQSKVVEEIRHEKKGH